MSDNECRFFTTEIGRCRKSFKNNFFKISSAFSSHAQRRIFESTLTMAKKKKAKKVAKKKATKKKASKKKR